MIFPLIKSRSQTLLARLRAAMFGTSVPAAIMTVDRIFSVRLPNDCAAGYHRTCLRAEYKCG